MNFLALKLDERSRIKLRRWYYHVADDGVAFVAWGIVGIMAFAVLVIVISGRLHP